MEVRPIASLSTDLAIANVGVQEVGENRGKAVEAYQASCKPPVPAGSPWCAAHVRFRHKQAATQLGIVYDETFPRSAYCPDWSRWFKSNGLWLPVQHIRDETTTKRPRRGDLALFYFSALSRIAHIGIVTKVEEWGVYTVEGNTSPEPSDELSVERDGDGLYAKKRNWSEFGKFGGFGFVNF